MTNPKLALFKTQRLDDTPAGGGQATSTIIPDNQADNLFGPISRVNRTDGNVSLRKAIVKALPATTQTFYGAHLIVAQPPANEDVSALAFYGDGSWTNQRKDVVDQIESYLVQGPQTRMWAYGQQVQGQRAILVYQPTSLPLPSIGDTYVMVNKSVTPNVTQFVRITTLRSEVQTFTDSVGNYQLNIITLGISAPLQHTFPGAEAQRNSSPVPPTILCITNVADAAKYYGVTTPAADIDAGAETATLTSVFGQLLPSTETGSPLTAERPQGATVIVQTGDIYRVGGGLLTFIHALYAGHSIMPGTVTVGSSFTDDGAGNIAGYGTVDYVQGVIYPTSTILQQTTLDCAPAVQVSQAGYTRQQPVTEGTRRYVYIDILNPLPAPATVTVSYRANGRWFDLTDDGSDALKGAEGAGSGTVRFDTGDVVVTLGALPDIGSNVVFAWGQPAEYDVRTGDTDIEIPAVHFTLSEAAKPGSVEITWVSGVTTKTVTDDGSGGLTGDGTGSIVYGAGLIVLRPTSLPNTTTGFSVAYESNPVTVQHLTPSKSGSDLSFTISNAPLAPKTIHILYDLTAPATYPYLFGGNPAIERSIYDDGAGGLVDSLYGPIAGSSVDYTTGACSFNPDLSTGVTTTPIYADSIHDVWTGHPATLTQYHYPYVVGWNHSTVTAGFVNGSAVTVTSTALADSSSSQTDNFPTAAITLDLTPKTVQPIVPGSVLFTFAGDTYVDRAGSLYRSINHGNNSGLASGSIDYTTGRALLTDWNAGGAQTLTIRALLCEKGVNPVSFLAARVAGQTVAPASFIIQANRKSDGALITATADANGDWSTDDMTGHIETATGFYTVAFGKTVLDSSLTSDEKAEPWYNSDNIDGSGHIWKPNEALAGSIRYSCVVETFLPLSASVLGLDPVRLPQDGRVLIFRAGDTLVFRNPLLYTFPGTVGAGDTTSLPRGSLESAVLYDADGFAVDIGLYAADLEAGSITMSDPCDLSDRGDGDPYAQPFVCRHTRGEMALCRDSQITGRVDWSPALEFDYPADSSYVSSALIAENAGNLQATYDTLFEQTTWNQDPDDLWDDVVHGTEPLASYNDVDYPIQVLDSDTITQRVMLRFTSSTAGQVIFEELGVVGTFDTSHNVAPINPATSQPYFILDYHGFGTGWSTGNAIRFNLRGAGFPVWFIRSVQVGASALLDDKFLTEVRWDE